MGSTCGCKEKDGTAPKGEVALQRPGEESNGKGYKMGAKAMSKRDQEDDKKFGKMTTNYDIKNKVTKVN